MTFTKTATDLAGQRFGRLTVLSRAENNKHGAAMWRCRCACEDMTFVTTLGQSLVDGKTKSCGCLRQEMATGRHAQNVLDRQAASMRTEPVEWVNDYRKDPAVIAEREKFHAEQRAIYADWSPEKWIWEMKQAANRARRRALLRGLPVEQMKVWWLPDA